MPQPPPIGDKDGNPLPAAPPVPAWRALFAPRAPLEATARLGAAGRGAGDESPFAGDRHAAAATAAAPPVAATPAANTTTTTPATNAPVTTTTADMNLSPRTQRGISPAAYGNEYEASAEALAVPPPAGLGSGAEGWSTTSSADCDDADRVAPADAAASAPAPTPEIANLCSGETTAPPMQAHHMVPSSVASVGHQRRPQHQTGMPPLEPLDLDSDSTLKDTSLGSVLNPEQPQPYQQHDQHGHSYGQHQDQLLPPLPPLPPPPPPQPHQVTPLSSALDRAAVAAALSPYPPRAEGLRRAPAPVLAAGAERYPQSQNRESHTLPSPAVFTPPAMHVPISDDPAVGALRQVLTGQQSLVMPVGLGTPDSGSDVLSAQGMSTSTVNDLAYLDYVERKLVDSIHKLESKLAESRSTVAGRTRRLQRRTPTVDSNQILPLRVIAAAGAAAPAAAGGGGGGGVGTGGEAIGQAIPGVGLPTGAGPPGAASSPRLTALAASSGYPAHHSPRRNPALHRRTMSHEIHQERPFGQQPNIHVHAAGGVSHSIFGQHGGGAEMDVPQPPLRQRIITVSLKLPTKTDREAARQQFFDSRLPPKAMFRLEEDADLPFVWVGSADPSLSRLHKSQRFDGVYTQAPLKRWRSVDQEDADNLHANKSRVVPVSLPDDPDVMQDFHTFCDNTLWNMLHNDYSSFSFDVMGASDSCWDAYRAVNECFAEAVSEIYEEGDLIWVHNYQLMLLPSLLRQRLWYAKIGFFLYAPFPSAEIFRILPYRAEILQGVLGADIVGFYTYDYSKQFAASCTRLLGLEGTPKGIEVEPRSTRHCEFGIYPAGIDVRELKTHIASPVVKQRIADLRRRFGDRKIIVGVDRLDDAFAGIPLKLHAFERFLTDNPQWHGRVVLIQVATLPGQASKMNSAHRAEINESIARINSQFGTLTFSPIHFITEELDPVEAHALLCVGHVCMVTPVRDGMGLVPHEWTVCQHGGNKGAIILSEFAGAAASFATALHVNPWDVDDVSVKIIDALEMKESERSMRDASAYKFVTTYTSSLWGLNFLEDLEQAEGESAAIGAQTTPPLDVSTVVQAFYSQRQPGLTVKSPSPLSPPPAAGAGIGGQFSQPAGHGNKLIGSKSLHSMAIPTAPAASSHGYGPFIGRSSSSRGLSGHRRKLFVLDYDGTLVPFQSIAELVAPPVHVLNLLQELTDKEDNYVVILSGRDRATLGQWFGNLNVFLAAEDGSFLRHPGETEWVALFRRTANKDFGARHLTADGNAIPPTPTATPMGTPHMSAKDLSVDADRVGGDIGEALAKSTSIGGAFALEGQGIPVYGGSDGEERGHERKGIDSHTDGDAGTDGQTKPAPLGRHKWSVSSFGSQVVADPGGIPEWKSQVKPIMHHFAERTPGVILEEGDATLTWHYTDADTVFGRFQARDLQKQLESFLLQHLSIEVVSEEGSSRYHTRWVKVRPSGVDKSLVIERALEWIRDEAGGYSSSVLPETGLTSGTTSRSGSHGSLSGSVGAIHRVSPGILESGSAGSLNKRPCLGEHGPVVDFVLCAGDDRADEGMFDLFGDDFKVAQLGLGPIKARIFTCRVGTGATSAATILESPQKLIELLEELCKEEQEGRFEEKPSLFSFQSSTGSLSKMAGNPGSW